jgi:hypothetical protein
MFYKFEYELNGFSSSRLVRAETQEEAEEKFKDYFSHLPQGHPEYWITEVWVES